LPEAKRVIEPKQEFRKNTQTNNIPKNISTSSINKPPFSPYTLPTTKPNLQTNHSHYFNTTVLICVLCPVSIVTIVFISSLFGLLPFPPHFCVQFLHSLLHGICFCLLNQSTPPHPFPLFIFVTSSITSATNGRHLIPGSSFLPLFSFYYSNKNFYHITNPPDNSFLSTRIGISSPSGITWHTL